MIATPRPPSVSPMRNILLEWLSQAVNRHLERHGKFWNCEYSRGPKC